MGLDLSHGRFHTSYSSFDNWRIHIAALVGIKLLNMKGFSGDVLWETLDPDPILVLLNHSDCDGLIPLENCTSLADRLAELVPQMSEYWIKELALDFIDSLRLAVKDNSDLEFC